jgi:hypothetical protein
LPADRIEPGETVSGTLTPAARAAAAKRSNCRISRMVSARLGTRAAALMPDI